MAKKKAASVRRSYDLRKRIALSDQKRTAILVAAKTQLASQGFLQFTMDGLASEVGVTRQTIHNLFGTKSELLEALFDQLALAGGMERMRSVMQESDPSRMVTGLVQVFCGFWATDRLLLRRIHGIAAIDPEFARVLAARNQRRWMAATRVIGRLGVKDAEQAAAKLYALTSFEFFDLLAEECPEGEVEKILIGMVERTLDAPSA
jgi:AcrR family transcriptional regulator